MEILSDLRARFCEIRDQGKRPTCMAFAISAAHEFLQSDDEPLSPEWLYFHGIQISGDPPDAGLANQTAIDALKEYGQPIEKTWPYEPAGLPSPWEPPERPNPIFYATGTNSGFIADVVIAALENDAPTVLSLLVDDTFFSWATIGGVSVIQEASMPRDLESGHAVVAVGHGLLNNERHILVRNSWGPSWADQGHAWISEEYATKRTFGAITLEEI